MHFYLLKNQLQVTAKVKSKWSLNFCHRLRYFFTIGFLCSLILVSCIKEVTPLRVGTNVWPGYEGFYLARNLGYYQNTAIKLVEYHSASEVIRSFLNGELEAAALTIDEVLLLSTSYPEVRVVLVTDISNGADVILAKPEIKDLKNLKGRRVGIESSAVGAFVITRALNQVGMTPKDIKIVRLVVSEHEEAFKQGKVDAVVTFEPVRSNLLAAGASLLFDSSQIPGEILDVLAVREEVLRTQMPVLKTLIKGWFKALDYLKNNPEDAARQIAPREGVSPEQFLKSLDKLHLPDIRENQTLLGKTEASLVNKARQLSKIMVENKLLKQAVDPALLLDDRLIKNLQP